MTAVARRAGRRRFDPSTLGGFRRIDRVRGSGWLDCPNCHEHALQDVVDEMDFLHVLHYRLTPVRRTRVLICRRCNHRRVAGRDEMSALETGGQPVHGALMFPIGVLGVGIVVGIVALIAHVSSASGGGAVVENIILVQKTGMGVAPIKFLGPSNWNYDAATDTDPPVLRVSDNAGDQFLAIRRIVQGGKPADVYAGHYNDEVGISATGFPDTPPCYRSTTVAGESAVTATVVYTNQEQKAEQMIFAFAHDGVGYTVTYVALGQKQIDTLAALAREINRSLKFTKSETPSPGPSASAPASGPASPGTGSSPGASASAPASAPAAATPSATASACSK